MKALAALGAAFSMAGCSSIITVPVTGQLQDSHEQFYGTAVSNLADGSGKLDVVSRAGGTACSGNFTMVTGRVGRGVLLCNDKRSGPFEFASTGRRGTGFGMLSGERFTFIFGE